MEMSRIDVYEARPGEFRWRMRDGEHRMLCVSQPFEDRAAARRGAESAQVAILGAEIHDLTDGPVS